MLSNVLRKKSLRQNNSIWLTIGVVWCGGLTYGVLLYGFAVKIGIRWGSSTGATLFDLLRGAGLNFYRQGQPRNTPIRDD